MTTVKLTREELYLQVWTMPMSKLAMHYGISDVALAKTCGRMNIPRPGRGYWQQLAAHVKVKRMPLPKAGPKQEAVVFLERVEAPQPRTPSPKAPEVPVSDTLQGAHDAVQRLGSLLQRAKSDAFGRLIVDGDSSPLLAVTVATHRRALLLLDALCKALGNRGHKIVLRREKKEGGVTARLAVTVAQTTLEAALVERLDRRERARTEEEQRSAALATKLAGKPPAPVYEQFACGQLQLVVRGITGARSSWSDGKKPLERHLGRILVTLEGEAERRRLQREAEARARMEAEVRRRQQEAEAERQRQEREAERQRQAELEARRQHELALVRDLRGMARRWTTAAEIRAFLVAVEGTVPVSDRTEGFTAWLRWATAHAEGLDPLAEPQKIPKVLEPTLPQERASRNDPGA